MRLLIQLSIRNFLKSPGLNSLNILGLSIGTIASLLILTYADHEYHYDQFHDKSGSIFRLEGRTNGAQWFSNLGMEHSKELGKGAYPEVIDQVMVNTARKAFFEFNDHKVIIEDIIRTNPGSSFFEFFDFDLVAGEKTTLLTEPRSAVITHSLAKRYFDEVSPIGQFIQFRDTIPMKITGVIQDVPSDSHFNFQIIYTSVDLYKREHFHTNAYLYLEANTDIAALERKIMEMDVAYDEYHKLSGVKLMPVPDIYLASEAAFGNAGKGDPLQLRVFLIIGALILLIAITNYVNLSLAIFLGKGRAVGVRKVFGESQATIFRNLLLESVATTLLTLPIIIFGYSIALPGLSIFLETPIENKLFTTLLFPMGLLVFLIIVSILTVLFPATRLSRMNVNALMKNKSALNISGGDNYRNGLVLFQFLLLFTLGISGWFMNQQIHYLDTKEMGFEAANIVKIGNAYDIGDFENYEVLKSKLLTYPQIAGVAFGPMMGDGMRPLAYTVEGTDEHFENLLSYGVDVDYFDVMGMEILAGDFKNVLRSSSNGQIVSLVNQSFIDRFDWNEAPIGKKITLWPGTENELNRKVSAVFNDFHFFSLKEKITPHIISLRPDPQFVNTNILVKSTTDNLEEVVKLVEKHWYELKPNLPLSYEFMDDAVAELYQKDKQTGRISIVFSVLAIGLSVLGMIGFMIYLIGLKAKELTVRKVLGASLAQIVGVLNQQLWFFVLTAGLFGSLFSYLLVDHWLQDYAYSIEMNIWVFPIAIILVYSVVLAISATRSIKWARTNPALTLSEE